MENPQEIDELIKSTRSFRRFDASVAVSRDTLVELVDLARISSCARNRQPLKYILSSEPGSNALIFSTLSWALDLKTWPGPAENERASAYIVVLCDREISPDTGHDAGIACQTIMLAARARGLGGCMLGSVDRNKLRDLLNIPERFDISLVLAIGKPAETVVLEHMPADGSHLYWRTTDEVHHVPKRSLDEIIIDIPAP